MGGKGGRTGAGSPPPTPGGGNNGGGNPLPGPGRGCGLILGPGNGSIARGGGEEGMPPSLSPLPSSMSSGTSLPAPLLTPPTSIGSEN